MTSSEESISADDTYDDDTLDHWDYPEIDRRGMFGDDDDCFDFDDEDRFSVLIDTLLESVEPGAPRAPVATNAADYLIRSAMGNASGASTSANHGSAEFGDFIRSYLIAPSLQPSSSSAPTSSPFYLSSNPRNEAERDDGRPAKVFVGNLPRGIVWTQLRDFFNDKGYSVTKVDVNNKNVRTNPSKPAQRRMLLVFVPPREIHPSHSFTLHLILYASQHCTIMTENRRHSR